MMRERSSSVGENPKGGKANINEPSPPSKLHHLIALLRREKEEGSAKSEGKSS